MKAKIAKMGYRDIKVFEVSGGCHEIYARTKGRQARRSLFRPSDRRGRPEQRRLIMAATAVESVRHRENLPLAMITDYKRAAERTDIDDAPVTGRR